MSRIEAGISHHEKSPYATVPGITFEQVVERIHFDREQPPMIYLAVAPCRSGTTAQLRPFAEQGMEAHYQPLKAIYRRLSHGIDKPFIIPSSSEVPAFFIKETLGPYKPDEAKFDPLKALLEARYPRERIQLLVEMREPLSALTSWIENFSKHISPDTLTDNYITAVRTVRGIYECAQADPDLRDPIPFVYEALRDNKPDVVSTKLLEKLGIEISGAKLSEKEVNENIIFAEEPEIYAPVRLHERFNEEQTLVYFPKSWKTVKEKITPEQALAIKPVYDTYHMFRKDTQQALGISISI